MSATTQTWSLALEPVIWVLQPKLSPYGSMVSPLELVVSYSGAHAIDSK